jgi:hypothetical protein
VPDCRAPPLIIELVGPRRPVAALRRPMLAHKRRTRARSQPKWRPATTGSSTPNASPRFRLGQSRWFANTASIHAAEQRDREFADSAVEEAVTSEPVSEVKFRSLGRFKA